MTTEAVPERGRMPTGNREFDALLGGGIPVGSVTMLVGNPGSGKTVLALQQLFHGAREGRRCLYVTTLSEPAVRLIHHMQFFNFFDYQAFEDRVTFRDLGDALLTQGPAVAREQLREIFEREEPELVVIDSFKVFRDLLSESEARPFMYELAVMLSTWGATTLLLGEYGEQDPMSLPEFAIADGIIRLGSARTGLISVRELEIVKMRGVDYARGVHLFDIQASGLQLYPRLRAPMPEEIEQGVADGRMTFGLPGLDAMLTGGLPRGSTTLVQGATGTGKTLLGLQFLLAGARNGEPGLHIGLEEAPVSLRSASEAFGWEIAELESRQLIRFHHHSPVELLADRFLHRVLELVDTTGAKRVVLDSLGALRAALAAEQRFRDLIYAFSQHMRARGVTTLMVLEAQELLSTSAVASQSAASIVDAVILLRYVEERARLARAISVLKVRGIGHSTELRRLTIGAQGPEVGEPFANVRGVLTGSPVVTEDVSRSSAG